MGFPDATVIGFESNLQAEDLARRRMDRVYAAAFEVLNADEPDLPKGRIDVALFLCPSKGTIRGALR